MCESVQRQADTIEITPAMVAAGVSELRDQTFALSHENLVEAIYLMMEIERRASELL